MFKLTKEQQLEMEDLKNKDELIDRIKQYDKTKTKMIAVLNQLKDMIDKTFKLWGI